MALVLKGRKPIAAEEIQSKVKGYGWESIATYGWESIATYEVQENGKLSKEEFWKDRFGGSPTHFWFVDLLRRRPTRPLRKAEEVGALDGA